jgi:hypothetical protein
LDRFGIDPDSNHLPISDPNHIPSLQELLS